MKKLTKMLSLSLTLARLIGLLAGCMTLCSMPASLIRIC